VPDSVHFATKPEIAAQMIARALVAGVPFAWVATDTIYGVGKIEMQLRRAGTGYGLGAQATDRFNSWGDKPDVAGTAEQIAQALAPEAWQRLSGGDGTKGPRLDDWAYVELADLEAQEYNADLTGLWTRGLLIRRNLLTQDLAFFSTWCPAGTPIDTLVAVEGQRWAIEDAFETAKTELGLTHNETRSWHGWHRHVSLVMLAFAMRAVVRQRANRLPSPQKKRGHQAVALVRWSVQEIRRVATRLAQRRIEPAFVIAWSTWRRAHQALAQKSHRKRSLRKQHVQL
jgi:SRSO17 transposase